MKSIFGRTVYTGRKVIKDAYVIFDDTEVVGVSKSKKGEFLGKFPVVTPAFVDPHNHIGIHRAAEPAAEQESNDHMDSVLVMPDVLDSIQMDDASFQDAIEMGVLYSCVLPGSGNIVGGLSAVIRNYGKDTSSALIGRAGIKVAFGYNLIAARERKGTRPTTRMGALALLRSKFDSMRQKLEKYRKAGPQKRQKIVFSSEETVLKGILAGKIRLRAHAHKTDDIASLLRVVDEYNLNVSVEHALDVYEPGIFRELRKRKIAVTYGPLDLVPGKVELKDKNWRNIRHLVESGVEYGLMTDHPVIPTWRILYETRFFLRFGLNKQDAVELVSRRNAEIIGMEDRLGTLEKGRWASFTCWNGDPFDVSSQPVLVYGEGRRLFAH